jgi:hypothetical protein
MLFLQPKEKNWRPYRLIVFLSFFLFFPAMKHKTITPENQSIRCFWRAKFLLLHINLINKWKAVYCGNIESTSTDIQNTHLNPTGKCSPPISFLVHI